MKKGDSIIITLYKSQKQVSGSKQWVKSIASLRERFYHSNVINQSLLFINFWIEVEVGRYFKRERDDFHFLETKLCLIYVLCFWSYKGMVCEHTLRMYAPVLYLCANYCRGFMCKVVQRPWMHAGKYSFFKPLTAKFGCCRAFAKLFSSCIRIFAYFLWTWADLRSVYQNKTFSITSAPSTLSSFFVDCQPVNHIVSR